MSITIFGLIWFLILIMCFFRNDVKYMVGITLLSMVFQSASVALLGETGVGPQIPTSIVMIAWCIMHSSVWKDGKLRLTKSNKNCKYSLIGIVGLVVAIHISREVNLRYYQMEGMRFTLLVIQLLIYAMCYISMWSIKGKIKETVLQNIFIGIICLVVAIGLVQFMVTTGVLPRNILLETLVYTPDTNSAYYWGTYNPRLFATFMEPSYCGPFLVGAFYYVVSLEKMNTFHISLALILVAEIMLTFSSTAYGSFAVCGVVYVILSKKKKALKYLVPIAIVVLCMLGVTGVLKDVLNDVIFSKGSSGSASTRGNWDRDAINAFVESPLFGGGYKNVRGSQFLFSLVGQVGIVGCLMWFVVWLPAVREWWMNKKSKSLSAMMWFLLGVVVAMFIAIPDLDNITFWQSMYLFALTSNATFYKKVNVERVL